MVNASHSAILLMQSGNFFSCAVLIGFVLVPTGKRTCTLKEGGHMYRWSLNVGVCLVSFWLKADKEK